MNPIHYIPTPQARAQPTQPAESTRTAGNSSGHLECRNPPKPPTGATAAGLYVLLIAVAEYFYHWNVRTPRWLGWFIQRPESHRVHHQYQKHTMNYADLPVLDWLFGTLQNPRHRVARCGFDAERES